MKPPQTAPSREASTDDPSARAERPRKPYTPPAIDDVGAFDAVTLGTKPPKAPGHGC